MISHRRWGRLWGRPLSLKGPGIFILVFTILAVTVLMRGLELLWPGHVSTSLIMMVFLLAINVITLMFGLGGGLIAAVLSFAALNFVFIEPRGAMLIHSSEDLIVLLVFVVVAGVNSQLLGTAQIGRIQAEQRERDATALSEFSVSLTSLRHSSDVAATVAEQVNRLIHARGVEVVILNEGDTPPVQAYSPPAFQTSAEQLAKSAVSPTYQALIESPRAPLGHVSVWRSEPPLDAGEQRLVRTMAGMTALALERIRLAQIEVRANVLEESDRLKSALLSSVSHELRTPLAAIRAGAESLNRGLVPLDSSAGRDLIANMDDAAHRLSKLVDNVMDMSRIESGVMKPRREWCLLADVVLETLLHVQNELKQHEVVTQVSDDLPLVPVDPIQLDQVFTNLLTNAAKYSPPNTPIDIVAEAVAQAVPKTASETADPVVTPAANQPAYIHVTVTNQSTHIPPEHLERIFDKFYRVTDADRVLGTGLGLSICKGIIEAHGGNIWAANVAGGVAFHFTLPLQVAGMAPPTMPAEIALG